MLSNDSTKNLEGMGRARGLMIQVRKIGGTKTSPYFLTSMNGEDLLPPRKIGDSIREAEDWIENHEVHPVAQPRPPRLSHYRSKKPMKTIGRR